MNLQQNIASSVKNLQALQIYFQHLNAMISILLILDPALLAQSIAPVVL